MNSNKQDRSTLFRYLAVIPLLALGILSFLATGGGGGGSQRVH